ncbi:hypothetical protein RJT34_03848 [Clitoria ternatea]|uniref:Uncharacterized protein n=1 Tax=Clitoria ternatea TaxID=43366 RepID=A0AAN9KMV5_CLITE
MKFSLSSAQARPGCSLKRATHLEVIFELIEARSSAQGALSSEKAHPDSHYKPRSSIQGFSLKHEGTSWSALKRAIS